MSDSTFGILLKVIPNQHLTLRKNKLITNNHQYQKNRYLIQLKKAFKSNKIKRVAILLVLRKNPHLKNHHPNQSKKKCKLNCLQLNPW